jgi:hypothetical protein
MSFHAQTGISVHVKPSIVTGLGIQQTTLTDVLSAYGHTIAALGGYESADVTINGNQVDVENWLEYGLGSHLDVYNAAMVKIWEGFVNGIVVTLGPLSVTRGPLIEVCNRASVTYGLLDTTQNPPVQQYNTETAIAEDADSQVKWGIWEQVLSAGQTTTADAESVRDAYLAEYAQPETSQVWTAGGQEVSVVLNCRGYQDWLDAGIYEQTVNSGTTQLETKMAGVLDDAGADPNGLFASANAEIFTAGILVPEYENENLKPRAIVNAMVALGDGTAADGRTVWGVYNDRHFIYDQIPTAAEYQQRLSEAYQHIETMAGATVEPWDVRPGKWLFFPDFMVGRVRPTTLRLDPRYMFIERVNYRAPLEISLDGGKTGNVAQILARMGMGGFR